MIKKILFISFFIGSSVSIVSQNIIVEYVKAYKNYRDTNNEVKPKVFKGLSYKLEILKNESKFKFVDGLLIDDANKRFIGRGGGSGIYYKNITTKEKLHQITSPINNKKYLIKNDFNSIKWELTKEYKIINEYKCYKAIGVNEYLNPINNKTVKATIIAWYTPEINVPFGPAGFDGLPGLVLEVRSSSFYFIANKIIFNKLKKIDKPVEGVKLTETEFNKMMLEGFKKMKM